MTALHRPSPQNLSEFLVFAYLDAAAKRATDRREHHVTLPSNVRALLLSVLCPAGAPLNRPLFVSTTSGLIELR